MRQTTAQRSNTEYYDDTVGILNAKVKPPPTKMRRGPLVEGGDVAGGHGAT
jgi:hypothetical protein